MAGIGSNMQQYLQGIQGLGRKLNTPTANMLGGAALGAGLSVAGNAMSGELEGEDAGRVALEALLAGAAAGAVGRKFGSDMRETAAINRVNNKINGRERLSIPLNKYQVIKNASENEGAYVHALTNTLGSTAVLGGMSAAAGLGGLLGGGVSDLTQAAGVSGFGSSNTASAKSGMGAATSAQPLYVDGMSSDPNEQYLAYLAANQIPYA